MQRMNEIFDSVCGAQEEAEDYRDETGLLRCGKCGGFKERMVEVPTSLRPNGRIKVKNPCPCQEERERLEEEDRRRRKFLDRMEELRRDGISDPLYLGYTFEQDDGKNPQFTKVCRRYVERWEEMRRENTGILFYGNVGTGKTFLAACIANALMGRLISAGITNLPRILNLMQSSRFEDRQRVIDNLQKYSLLVIDDLGVERDTSYSIETVFHIMDARARAGKPLIVTTNLSMNDLEHPRDLSYQRIFDRVLGLCPIRLNFTGTSRRTEEAMQKRRRAKEILGEKECGNTN